MRQKINLLTNMTKPEKDILPPRKMFLYAVILIVCLLLLFFIQLGRRVHLHTKVNDLEDRSF